MIEYVIAFVSISLWLFIVFALGMIYKLSIYIALVIIVPLIVIFLNCISSINNHDTKDESVARNEMFLVFVVSIGLLITILGGKDVILARSNNYVSIGLIYLVAIALIGIASLNVSIPIKSKHSMNIRRNIEAMAASLLLYALIRYFEDMEKENGKNLEASPRKPKSFPFN